MGRYWILLGDYGKVRGTMRKALYTIATITFIIFLTFIVLAITSPKAKAAEVDDPEKVCVVPPPVTVYVDKPVTVYVDRPVNTVHYTQVPVEKIVYVEKPVYETNPETSDPKVVRAMMKVTHDRYLALLAKYRALKPRR